MHSLEVELDTEIELTQLGLVVDLFVQVGEGDPMNVTVVLETVDATVKLGVLLAIPEKNDLAKLLLPQLMNATCVLSNLHAVNVTKLDLNFTVTSVSEIGWEQIAPLVEDQLTPVPISPCISLSLS